MSFFFEYGCSDDLEQERKVPVLFKNDFIALCVKAKDEDKTQNPILYLWYQTLKQYNHTGFNAQVNMKCFINEVLVNGLGNKALVFKEWGGGYQLKGGDSISVVANILRFDSFEQISSQLKISESDSWDIAVSFGENKLYCHSQILSVHSSVMKDLMEGKNFDFAKLKNYKQNDKIDTKDVSMDTDHEDDEDDENDDTSKQVDQEGSVNSNETEDVAKKREIIINIKNLEFDDILNVFNILYGYSYHITDENVKRLSRVAFIFKMERALCSCGEFLLSSSRLGISERILLLWKYDMGHFKYNMWDQVTDTISLHKVFTYKEYQSMRKDDKLAFQEYLLYKIIGIPL